MRIGGGRYDGRLHEGGQLAVGIGRHDRRCVQYGSRQASERRPSIGRLFQFVVLEDQFRWLLVWRPRGVEFSRLTVFQLGIPKKLFEFGKLLFPAFRLENIGGDLFPVLLRFAGLRAGHTLHAVLIVHDLQRSIVQLIVVTHAVHQQTALLIAPFLVGAGGELKIEDHKKNAGDQVHLFASSFG